MEPAPQKIKRKYLNQQDLIRSGFDKATDFHGAYASVEKRRKWFIIDTLGNRICKNYDDAFYFSEGRARVGLNGKYGYIDESGKEVIPLIYDEVEEWFNDGRAGVKLKGRWGFVDTKGNQVIKCKYQQVWWFSYGVAKVFADKKFLFIDKFGNEVLNLRNDAKKYWESLEKCTQYRLK